MSGQTYYREIKSADSNSWWVIQSTTIQNQYLQNYGLLLKYGEMFILFVGTNRIVKASTSSHSSELSSTSLNESRLSTTYLTTILRLENQQHRSSTDHTYYSAWKNFNNFIIRLDIRPSKWEDRLALWITFLVENDKQPGTIQSYASTVKSILASENININHDSYNLSALVQACRLKKDSHTVMTRIPINRQLHDSILDKIQDRYMNEN